MRKALTAALFAASALVAVPATGAAATAGATAGAATVVPIQVTGAPSARFNLVVLGDGYTEAELPTFRQHVEKHMNIMWTIEPFKSYRSYFNVYAVEIVSAESGVDCDPGLSEPRRDTALNMGFWGGCNPASVQRLLVMDNAAAVRYANMVPGTSSANRQILALGNSLTYGGAGGTYATASGGNSLSGLISPHELGHSLGGLQDEYDYYQRAVPGDPYEGSEPSSIHHSLLTEQQMRDQQAKWWRWLGEASESGGVIGRFEGGMYSVSGVWRPSKHSMMKSLGFYFDQPSRERMTQRIAAKVGLITGHTPNSGPIGADRVVSVDTMHPVSHVLRVKWTLDGAPLPGGRSVDLSTLELTPGTHKLTVTVSDPTEFVRDPAVRSSMALTQVRTWTVDTTVVTPPVTTPVTFTASTPTDLPVGGTSVVFAETSRPMAIAWQLDGHPVTADRDLDLATLSLTPGEHTVTASVGSHSLEWTVDAAAPSAAYELSRPLLQVGPDAYIFNGPFTLGLHGNDDNVGHVVNEFRVDKDGWHNYYGSPTDPNAPFPLTATGTNVDGLIYGSLGPEGLSSSPFAEHKPGYGRHLIEYRAIDPAGNVGPTRSFTAALIPSPPTCTSVITGVHNGPLRVTSGVTCLNGAHVNGPVTVSTGAALVANNATITGPITAAASATVQLLTSTVAGPVRISGTATMVGSRVVGPVTVGGGTIASNTIIGPLTCTAKPDDLGAPNTVYGPSTCF